MARLLTFRALILVGLLTSTAGALAQTPPQVGLPPMTPSAPSAAPAPENPANVGLMQAAMTGNVAGIRTALAQGADLTALTESGASALSVAAMYGRADAIQELLTRGANV